MTAERNLDDDAIIQHYIPSEDIVPASVPRLNFPNADIAVSGIYSGQIALISAARIVTETIFKINPRAKPFEFYVNANLKPDDEKFWDSLNPHVARVIEEYPGIEVALCDGIYYFSNIYGHKPGNYRMGAGPDPNCHVSRKLEDLLFEHIGSFVPDYLHKSTIALDLQNPEKTSGRAKMILEKSCEFRHW